MTHRRAVTTTVGSVARDLLRRPREILVRQWNWKSALFSALFRGAIFFAVNASAGWRAATGAMAAEFAYRSLTAGFYGSIAQAFRRAEPRWAATLVVMVATPAVAHSLEFFIHWLRGTPKLALSVAVSIGFTILASLFNLHAMRHGAMVVGDEGATLASDMKRMPRIIVSFVLSIFGRGSRPLR